MANETNISPPELYSVADVTAALGISRTTLLYYESIGLVHPSRVEGTGYRMYTVHDLFSLMADIILKNMGIPLKELGTAQGEDPYDPCNIQQYLDIFDLRIEYLSAQRDCFGRLCSLIDRVGQFWEEDVERYVVRWSSAADGYRGYENNVVLDELVESMPLGSLAALLDEDFFAGGSNSRRGRSVPERYAHLLPGVAQETGHLGGCLCLATSFCVDNDAVSLFCPDEVRKQLADELHRRNLVQNGRVFTPYSLPTPDHFYIPLYVPVCRY